MKNRTRKKHLQAQRAGMSFPWKLTADDLAWLDAPPVGREFGSIARQHSIREPGAMKGTIKIADDFDAPLPEVVQSAFDK